MCAWLCVHEYVIPLVFMPQRYPRWHEITESAVCMFLPATDSSCQSVSLAYCHLVSFSLSLSLSLPIHLCGCRKRMPCFFFLFLSAVLVLWVEVKHWRKKRKKNRTHTCSRLQCSNNDNDKLILWCPVLSPSCLSPSALCWMNMVLF